MEGRTRESMALSKQEQQVAAMEKATVTVAGAEGVGSVPVGSSKDGGVDGVKGEGGGGVGSEEAKP